MPDFEVRMQKCAMSDCENMDFVLEPFGIGRPGCFSLCPECAVLFKQSWVQRHELDKLRSLQDRLKDSLGDLLNHAEGDYGACDCPTCEEARAAIKAAEGEKL